MVQAAVTGAIDFAQADPDNPLWWRKLDWVLCDLVRRANYDAALARQQHSLAFVSHGRLEPASFQTATENAAAALKSILAYLYPWDATAGRDVSNLEELWTNVFGDPNSPEVQAMIDAGIEAMQRLPVDIVDEDD